MPSVEWCEALAAGVSIGWNRLASALHLSNYQQYIKSVAWFDVPEVIGRSCSHYDLTNENPASVMLWQGFDFVNLFFVYVFPPPEGRGLGGGQICKLFHPHSLTA